MMTKLADYKDVRGNMYIEGDRIYHKVELERHWLVEEFTEEQALAFASGLIEMAGRLRAEREAKV